MSMTIRWGAALLLGVAAGCGPALPPATDQAVARAAIEAALDAWKAGKPADTLKTLTPQVDFVDLSWQKGAALEGYEIKKEERSGQSVRFSVALKLKVGDASRERVATYTADAGPNLVVIRPEM